MRNFIQRLKSMLEPLPAEMKWGVWLGLLTASSVAFSLSLACATPFAALVTLAALNMERRNALTVTVTVWLANQAVGFGFLHYPQTFDSYAWGIAIGVAAAVALWTAMELARRMQPAGAFIETIIAFAGAFVTYEVLLYMTAFLLPGSEGAFSWPIVRWVLLINLLALTGLLALHRVASTLGLAGQRPISVATAATS